MTMKIVFAGDCEKHDLVLTTALLFQAARPEEKVSVITDVSRLYRHFQGEVSGVSIHLEGEAEAEVVQLYDWHQESLPCTDPDRVILVTACDRSSLEFAKAFLQNHEVDALLWVRSDCAITPKYIAAYLPVKQILSYWDSPRRRIDWIYDGRVDLRGLESDFSQEIDVMMTDLYEIPKPQLKKIWSFIKKRR
jgi:hypothetical protein